MLTDIMRLWEMSLAAIAAGATPIYLPVVGVSWKMLIEASGRREVGKVE